MEDDISSLKNTLSDAKPLPKELKILNELFKEDRNSKRFKRLSFKDAVIAGIIFLILSLPFLDKLNDIITVHPIVFIGLKCIAFIAIFYIVERFFLKDEEDDEE